MSQQRSTRDTAEHLHLGIIPKDGRVHFWEDRGEIRFGYAKRYRNRELKLSGSVPKDIQRRDARVIRAHAAQIVRAWWRKHRTEIDRFDAYEAHPDFPVTTKDRGVVLTGRIVSAVNSTLRVRLETPYTGERHIEYRWASAMAGHFIFTKSGEFSADAIATAKYLLVEIYRKEQHRERHRDTIALADRLNRNSMAPRTPSPTSR